MGLILGIGIYQAEYFIYLVVCFCLPALRSVINANRILSNKEVRLSPLKYAAFLTFPADFHNSANIYYLLMKLPSYKLLITDSIMDVRASVMFVKKL